MSNLLTNPNHILNVEGLRCPEPIMMVRRTMRYMKEGETLLVSADDPTTQWDIFNFCYFMEHTLIDKSLETIPYLYLIRKNVRRDSE